MTPTFLPIVTCPVPATPVKVSATAMACKGVTFIGLRDSRTFNTNVVWITLSSVDGSRGIPVMPGALVSFPTEQPILVSDFYVQAVTADDGVLAIII